MLPFVFLLMLKTEVIFIFLNKRKKTVTVEWRYDLTVSKTKKFLQSEYFFPLFFFCEKMDGD